MKAGKYRFRFGVKSLIVLIAVFSFPLAWLTHHLSTYKREQDAIRELFSSSPIKSKYVVTQTDVELQSFVNSFL